MLCLVWFGLIWIGWIPTPVTELVCKVSTFRGLDGRDFPKNSKKKFAYQCVLHLLLTERSWDLLLTSNSMHLNELHCCVFVYKQVSAPRIRLILGRKNLRGGSLGKNPSRDRPIFAPCVLSRPARMHLNSHQWDHLHIASHHHFQLFKFPNQVASSFLCDLNMVDFDQVPSLVTSGDTWKQIYICLLKHRHRPPVTFWHQMVAKKGRRPDRRLGRPNQLIVWNVDQSRHLLLLDRPPNHRYFWG